jgi:hypothetical protein
MRSRLRINSRILNVVAISNESGTQWLGGITQFGQYWPLLERGRPALTRTAIR